MGWLSIRVHMTFTTSEKTWHMQELRGNLMLEWGRRRSLSSWRISVPVKGDVSG